MRRKPEINQPGRLLGHLMNELNVESDSTRSKSAIIERALDKLATDGIVELDKTGCVLNGYRVTAKGERELNPQRRTRKAAVLGSAVSAQPIESPVVPVTSIPAAPKEPLVVDVAPPSSPMPRHELVTLALKVLQESADKQGYLFVPSSAALIAEKLGISEAEAKELNAPLGQLGLRRSPQGRNSGAKPHWVSMDIVDVTVDMLAAAGKVKLSEPTEAEQLVVIISDLEQELAQAHADAETAEALNAIIGNLETENADFRTTAERNQTAMQEAAGELDRLGSELTQAQADNVSLQTQLREANAKLLVRAAPSAAVRETLARYGK